MHLIAIRSCAMTDVRVPTCCFSKSARMDATGKVSMYGSRYEVEVSEIVSFIASRSTYRYLPIDRIRSGAARRIEKIKH